MNPKKIARLRQEIAALRNKGGVRGSELESVARRVGRRLHARGKHPTWVMKGRFPLSIPKHPGEMRRGTVKSILDHLEDDLDEIEALDDSDEGGEDVYH